MIDTLRNTTQEPLWRSALLLIPRAIGGYIDYALRIVREDDQAYARMSEEERRDKLGDDFP